MQGFRPEATRVTVAHQTIALSVICMTSSVMLHQTTAASTKAHGTVAAAVPGLPSGATVGSGWGTNIHWTLETRPGEAAMLAKAYKVARMDFTWGKIESKCGEYNFSSYDTLLATMEAHGVQPYWILDYGNPCYPPIPDAACKTEASCKAACGSTFNTCSDGVWYCCATKDGDQPCRGTHTCSTNPHLESCACPKPPPPAPSPSAAFLAPRRGSPKAKAGWTDEGCNSPACIAAFGRFAAAAATHFKGKNIIFECLNEPNGMGGDNSSVITSLCLAAGEEMTKAGAVFVGPATSGFAWDYLNASMADGILGAFSAVSVHPYRGDPPETVLDDYTRLRAMIQSHGSTPAQQTLPVVSGEWGYTSATLPCVYSNRVNASVQAAYLARMWLINTLAEIPVSINYDWSDGGTDPTNCEDNFGSVAQSPVPTPGPNSEPFTRKPAYTAALTLQSTLGGFETAGPRLPVTSTTPSGVLDSEVFVLPFHKRTGEIAFAVWSNHTAEGTCAGAEVKSRTDCGYLHISKEACLSPSNPKGPTCCWEQNSSTVGGPQCYRVMNPAAVTVVFKLPSGTPRRQTESQQASEASECFAVTEMLGGSADKVCADAQGILSVETGAGTPVYLTQA